MRRYISPPLDFDDAGEAVAREKWIGADLVLYGVDHSGASYEGRVYFNNTKANLDTSRTVEDGYVGSFTIFGHNGCYGDLGHCDINDRPADPFDVRATHPLTPATIVLDVSEALSRTITNRIIVTIVPAIPGEENKLGSDVLSLERIRLLTYLE